MYKTSGGQEDISSSLANVNDTYNDTDGTAELIRQAQDSILAVLSNGAGITINVTAGIPNFVLALPSSFKNQTRGLSGKLQWGQIRMTSFLGIKSVHYQTQFQTKRFMRMFGQTCMFLLVSITTTNLVLFCLLSNYLIYCRGCH